jgi:hypothetical protein
MNKFGPKTHSVQLSGTAAMSNENQAERLMMEILEKERHKKVQKVRDRGLKG